jgi:predicted NAD/FAD-binding protein
VRAGGSESRFDAVVMAAHADQSLALLADASPEEQRLLGAWKYQGNRVVLHHDATLLPSNPAARASWNYLRRKDGAEGLPSTLTYDMNRLQGLRCERQYCVTLNCDDRIDPSKILRSLDYEHPVYDAAAVATQPLLPGLNGVKRTWFCGSYFSHGFHEDAVRSGVAVAADFGVGW